MTVTNPTTSPKERTMTFPTDLQALEEAEFGFGPRLWDADPDVCCAAFQLGACEHTEAVYDDHMADEDRCEYGYCDQPGRWIGEFFVCPDHAGSLVTTVPDLGDEPF